MNFFEHQDQARKNSARLSFLFVVAVVGVIVTIYLLVAIGLRTQVPDRSLFDPMLLLKVGGGVAAVILLGSLIKVAALSAGGSAVAESLGGRLVTHSTRDQAERRLVNLVEEMAIASGSPVPQIYVLDQEEGLNAFAAGHRPEDAAIAVTAGTLKSLTRDELQGVIGHEFSHILNGDMRLNIRLIGMLGGIMAVAIIGRIVLRAGSFSRKKEAAGLALAGLALMVIGYIGVLAGRILQAAISRQREFLADASAVQFTRNPDGIAGALRKIGGAATGSRIAAPAAAEMSHMFFGSISLSSIFATHPPLDERIRRIDGNAAELLAQPTPQRAAAPQPAGAAMGFAGAGAEPSVGVTPKPVAPTADSLSRSVGSLTPQSIDASTKLLASLPEPVQQAVRSPLGACAVTWALLLDSDLEKRGVQVEQLRSFAPRPLFDETATIFPHVKTLDPLWKLPLVDLAIPSLRSLSPSQFLGLRQGLELLVKADDEVTLFEFCLWTIIDRRVGVAASNDRPRRSRRISVQALRTHTATLLGAVCHAGHADPTTAAAAFAATVTAFAGLLSPADRLSEEPFSAVALAESLSVLADASFKHRKKLLEACSTCVLFDRVIEADEAHLLRAIAYSLDLPLPPVLSTN